MPPLLRLTSVTVSLERHQQREDILRDLTFELHQGEILGLVGESGSGKSMTARTIMRLLPSNARVTGTVELQGKAIPDRGPQLRKLRTYQMGMIFQDCRATIDPLHTIEHHLVSPVVRSGRFTRAEARDRGAQLLADLGIIDPLRILRSRSHELSGGMLQRVMIAGELISEPKMLIADEPTTALDVTIQAEIVAILNELRCSREIGILFITHDLDLAAQLCDRIGVMYAGQIVEMQPSDAIFTKPRHPYTAALFDSRPDPHRLGARLRSIPGDPPDPFHRPSGCSFHPRCPYRIERCDAAEPRLEVDRDVAARCIRQSELSLELSRAT